MRWSWPCRIALSLSLAIAGTAQAGSIRGTVYDKDFQAPLPGASVQNVETGETVTTSDQGNFVFSQLPPGKYTLVVAKDGYARQVRSDLVVSGGQLTEVEVHLSGDFTDMEEFVVQDILQLGGGTEAGLLQLRFESPALMDSISSELMSRAGASDAASALRIVAGASVKDGKSAVIRGLPDRYVSSQMNSVRLPTADEDKRAVELDQFPSAVIESIQVSKTFTPDQQGDASGGAVNVQLKGVPEDPLFFRFETQYSHNTQVTGRSRFLTYDGGGVHFWGKDDGSRERQLDNIGRNWDGAVGVSRDEAPLDYKWSAALGGKQEVANGVELGGFASLFYERDSSFYDDGIDDSKWVENPGDPMTPKSFQGTPQDGDFKTALFDVSQGQQTVQWGGLVTLGLETENHSVTVAYLQTRTTEDAATLTEDTRGKEFYFPGHEPDDLTTPGHSEPDAAPYLRLETLEYTERSTTTFQLSGRHTLPFRGLRVIGAPVFDWTASRSAADLLQPDKRQFGTLWQPGRLVGPVFIPPTHRGYKPAANFTLGNLQRIWKEIEEKSEQYTLNLELPFGRWADDRGYFKVGWFDDRVDRTFDQDTFSNFGDNSSFEGPFGQFWSGVFPLENHPITESQFDVDYRGKQAISAWYLMADLPLRSNLSLIGGARFEDTRIGIVNQPEANATWFPPGDIAPRQLNPGDADVDFHEDEVLPSIGVVYTPFEALTLRTSYNETVARQTFKELTPILQQEFLGGPVFIGNPELQMSRLKNYDVRADYTPYQGGLVSASWFRKDLNGPIEYVQRVSSAFDFTTAVNYPRGRIVGYELEVRQDLGYFWSGVEGMSVGANATFIDSVVTLPRDEADDFAAPGIEAPITERDMTAAPDHLYNYYVTYDIAPTGTQLSVFYTVQGDTLVAGAGIADTNFVPSLYLKEFDTLNVSVSQRLGAHTRLRLQAKNLTDPEVEQVYRSPYIGADVTKSRYTRGVEYSLTLGGEFTF